MATGATATENGKSEVGNADESVSELVQSSKAYVNDGEGGEVVTPNGRPVRERKSVDRYSLSSPTSRSSTPKTLSIAKGSGTPLKDIPNVAFKLSKRKSDDTLQQLHMILFGKRAKAQSLKKDIGLFSGFVWEENEEKQRAKMKERLDKFVKDKLVDFCDVLNIPIVKSVKKEDLLVKLLEFLESPHATTEVLLADKEQKKKRLAKSSRSRSKNASGEKSAKKTQSGEKRKGSSTGEENETDDMDDKMSSQSHSSGEEDDALPKQDSDQEHMSSDEEKDEVKDKKTSPKNSSKDNSEAKSGTKSVNLKKSSIAKSPKSPSKSGKKTKDAPKGRGSSSKKRQKVDEETKQKKSVSTAKSLRKKQGSKSTKSLGGEEETNEEDKVEPTKEELHAVAVNILKEVDFNTATLSDILRLLGSHFGVDLMHRKKEVKAVIQEVIESMSDGDSGKGEDDDNEEEDAEGDKDSGEE